jgi:predicted short-subunit dehydrogenase-like oxidoreductase (DUF2520 family)
MYIRVYSYWKGKDRLVPLYIFRLFIVRHVSEISIRGAPRMNKLYDEYFRDCATCKGWAELNRLVVTISENYACAGHPAMN